MTRRFFLTLLANLLAFAGFGCSKQATPNGQMSEPQMTQEEWEAFAKQWRDCDMSQHPR